MKGNIIEVAEKHLEVFLANVPSTLMVDGVNVSECISIHTDARQLMTIFNCYNSLLKDYKERFDVVLDKVGFIKERLLELDSIGEFTAKEQFDLALRIEENPDYEDPKIIQKAILRFVSDDLRQGYNRKLQYYAFLVLGEKTKDGQYNINVDLFYYIGLAAAIVEMESWLNGKLAIEEREEVQRLEDQTYMERADKEVVKKTTQLVTILDALGIIDFLKQQTLDEKSIEPSPTIMARKIARFTNFSMENIRPILRELGAKTRNNPLNTERNKELFEQTKKDFNL